MDRRTWTVAQAIQHDKLDWAAKERMANTARSESRQESMPPSRGNLALALVLLAILVAMLVFAHAVVIGGVKV